MSARRVRALAAPARWSEYRALLHEALDAGYRIAALHAWLDEPLTGPTGAPVLVLRHDVDQAPHAASAMAAVEEGLGLTSTWYVRWRTADARTVARLQRAGHEVGLHYETLSRLVRARRLGPEDSLDPLVPEARAVLAGEVAAFRARFGHLRSTCPHGDTAVPWVRNALALPTEDLGRLGLAFDARAAMARRPDIAWVTDRSAARGRWGTPTAGAAIAARHSPLVLVTHPNNWASGRTLLQARLRRRSDAPPGQDAI